MEDAGLKWSDLSKIILVGGSTRVPAVQNMIKELSGIEPSHELNPDEAVAIGAAYYADSRGSRETGKKAKAEKVIGVTDVNSHSLGIVYTDAGGDGKEHVGFIIKRNTALPASGEKEFSTMHDGQMKLFIQVAEGEDDDPRDCRIIGTSELLMRTARPANSPLSVAMNYDEDGIVHVRVRDLVDGADLGEMHLSRDSNLSAADVNEKKMVIGDINIE